MAYKIQVGDAIMGGTLTQEGQLAAEGSHLSASAVSASGDVIIQGGGAATAGLHLRNGGTVRAGESIYLRGTDEQWFKMESDSGDGKFTFTKDTGGGHIMATLGTDSNNGSLQLASNTDANVKVSLINGVLSGSQNLDVGGNLDAGSNVTINGNLTISGTETVLDVDTFETADRIVILANGGSGNGGGLAFGNTGSNGQGARLALSVGSPNKFQAVDGNGGDLINISASAFFGSGVQLNNVTTSGFLLSPNTLTSGELSIGLNLIDIENETRNVTLPTGSNLEAGQEIIVKCTTAAGTGTCTITRAGTDTIDGENSIVLESDHAAVSLVYDNSGSFKIF